MVERLSAQLGEAEQRIQAAKAAAVAEVAGAAAEVAAEAIARLIGVTPPAGAASAAVDAARRDGVG